MGPARDEGLHARKHEGIASSHRRRARPLPRVGEGEGRRELAPQHGQEKALALGSRGQSQEPAVASENAVVENALRSRDLLVQRDPAERPQPAAAQLEGLGQAIESELGRAGARPAPQRGSHLAFLHDLLPPLRGEHLVLEEAAQGFPERGEGGRELGIHATKCLRSGGVRPQRDTGEGDLGGGGDAEARGVPRGQLARGKCFTYSALISR